MTALLERPDAQRRARARAGQPPPQRSRGRAATLGVTALVVAAILPFGRVFATSDWVVPLLLAGVLPVALSWGMRQLRVPWWLALPLTLFGWLWYTAVVLLPSTLWSGLLPTLSTVQVAADATRIAIQRIAMLPAPVYPETPLLLLAVTGVWWVASSIDILALRLGSPGKAVICATTLWLVPLAIVPDGDPPWLLSAPLLLSSVLVMLTEADRDALRWGRIVAPTSQRAGATPRHPSGMALAVGAVVVGALLAGLLPGFGDPPWYQLRAQATTTLTDNPIVQLRTNLVAQDNGPILRVRTEEPIYLRSTALDTYSENEEWTASDSGIELLPLNRGFVPGGNFTAQRKQVRVEVLNLDNADLVPAPTGPVRFRPPDGLRPLYDPRTSTFVFENAKLSSGQRYEVMASTPEINPDVAASVDTPAEPQLTQLPERLPDEVGRLARQIVENADATSPFMQALAIQNELRSWEYSLEPPPGHSGVAMRTFLENRIGYCEQFAGTMAVMLRTLGIPARVAVGFTPGTINPDDPTLWTVTWANAHAWVEVKFGGEWIAFEPTPRADGNVLVPSVRDLTPAMTAQDPQTTGETLAPPPGTNDPQFDIFDEREALQNRDPRAAQNDLATGGGTRVSRRLTDPTLLVSVGVLVLAVLALLVLIGRRQTAVTGPRSRILSVREQIGRLGHGLGVSPPAWETDTEYLTRLGGDSAAGTVLADACTQARYAPEVSVAVAERAEQAGMELTRALVAERPRWQRSLIRVRGDLVAGWRRLRQRG
jgi:transglutaminase-like putative cysteine protease